MKYQPSKEQIPQSHRKELNDKILFLIDSKTSDDHSITHEDIFQSFTGKGSLHNLNFKDFDNYYEYGEAKKLEEIGQFFTPPKICEFIINCLKPSSKDLIADLTCGSGNFFNFCPKEENTFGSELDKSAFKVTRFLYPNSNIVNDDIRCYDPKISFDIIVGNPPFNLSWKVGKEEHLSQLYYFIKASELLKPAGILSLIVPSSFLNDTFMNKRAIEIIDQSFNFIHSIELPKSIFKEFGVSNFETKVMFFQKKSQHLKDAPYNTWNSSYIGIFPTKETSDQIYKQYLEPIFQEKYKIHAKLLLENNSNKSKEDLEFDYQVQKLIFDIKSHKNTKSKFQKANQLVLEYYHQKCPEGMSYDDFQKIKITKEKVLKYLKKILKERFLVEKDLISLVKTNHGLKLKAYSNKSKTELKKYIGTQSASFNDMVLNSSYPFQNPTYSKLLLKKRIKYTKNELKFKSLDTIPEVKEIQDWITNYPIYDSKENQILKLTPTQSLATAKMIYKGSGILDFEMGSGKTLCAINWYRYLKTKTNYTFVLAPSIAIKLNWEVVLKNYQEDFIVLDSLQKFSQIKPHNVILLSFDMLRKYEKQIKKFVKINSNKISLVLDESDNLTNHNSKRTLSTKNVFRKAKYKLLTTGTTTRNNISEIYSQLELLYNNSINMICECPIIFKMDKNELKESLNPYFLKPFPAYFGNGLFKSCFNPSKATVFGIKKENQDIFNKEHLVNLIEKTIITKSFFDITGKKPQFETIQVNQNPQEEFVYEIIINEFQKMLYNFKNSGNSRKETMLKIIRQIQLLIKATSLPQSFKEYNSFSIPQKQLEILKLVKGYDQEKIAIGTIFKSTCKHYYNTLKNEFPNRQIFLIEGSIPFKERKKIIAAFELTQNGILISTQQSLSSSVNIPSCDKIIIESLMWNLPKISQYYMRFIRFNSEIEKKKVIFVAYKNTIEMNLLALLMDKQRINDFIKNPELKSRDNIFKEYGIDFNLIDMILEKTKEKDSKGRESIKINWGSQKIV